MRSPHVVLLPGSGMDRSAVAAELVGDGIDCYCPPEAQLDPELPEQLADARRVAAVAQWLAGAAVPPPVVLVAAGSAARLLPALSLSQRSAARLVVGYVLIDAPSPAPSHEWPDAPVWWVSTPAASAEVEAGALSADLRGFEVLSAGSAAAAVHRVLVDLGRSRP
ncbi:MAG: hypothetical protein H6525_02720 [Actinobacteria bacterium]|nr:hypothetical protein [Actinomycetota bacterium]MCB9411753.1 hypothetical protein [Actinomycetota bacterium]